MRARECPRCGGVLILDQEADEVVCFTCSRRYKLDGSATTANYQKPGRDDQRIAGMRF